MTPSQLMLLCQGRAVILINSSSSDTDLGQ